MNHTNEEQFLHAMLNAKIREFENMDAKIVELHKLHEEMHRHITALNTLLKSTKTSAKPAKAHTIGQFPPSIGFRDAVREILRDGDNNKGLSTKEIRENMIARGYSYTAETPLAVRISNEMRRMVQQRIMTKEGNKYSLTKKGWDM